MRSRHSAVARRSSLGSCDRRCGPTIACSPVIRITARRSTVVRVSGPTSWAGRATSIFPCRRAIHWCKVHRTGDRPTARILVRRGRAFVSPGSSPRPELRHCLLGNVRRESGIESRPEPAIRDRSREAQSRAVGAREDVHRRASRRKRVSSDHGPISDRPRGAWHSKSGDSGTNAKRAIRPRPS